MKKAIIIAAGLGTRLRPLTKNLPKYLLSVGSKSILDSQIEIYKSLKIKKINIICGYKKNKFNKINAKFFYNKNYKKNNILESLFYAKSILNSECIVSYSDIIFKKKVIEKICNHKADISIIIDVDWKKNYINRDMHPVSEAEKALCDKNGNLIKVGKNLKNSSNCNEFIGVLKLSKLGCSIFNKFYKIAKYKYKNKKFFNAKNISKAYLSDFLNFLILNKINVKCVKIKGGWMEIDTVQDLIKAQNFFN